MLRYCFALQESQVGKHGKAPLLHACLIELGFPRFRLRPQDWPYQNSWSQVAMMFADASFTRPFHLTCILILKTDIHWNFSCAATSYIPSSSLSSSPRTHRRSPIFFMHSPSTEVKIFAADVHSISFPCRVFNPRIQHDHKQKEDVVDKPTRVKKSNKPCIEISHHLPVLGYGSFLHIFSWSPRRRSRRERNSPKVEPLLFLSNDMVTRLQE